MKFSGNPLYRRTAPFTRAGIAGRLRVTRSARHIVQQVQCVGQARIVAVGEIGSKPRVVPQVQRCRLRYTARRSSHRPKAVSGDVDAVEDLVQQGGLAAGAHRVESFLQSVSQVIGLIDLKLGVPLLPAESAEIANIDGHVVADASRHGRT